MAALLKGLGPTVVPAPGTPVQVVVPSVINPPSCHACIIEALSTNTGKTYVGTAGMNKATLADVLVVLPIPTANLIPTFSISIVTGANALHLPGLWIDADIVGEGVLISAVVA